MRKTYTAVLSALAAATSIVLPTAAHAAMPQLVQAYVDSLVKQCGGQLTPALSAQVIHQIDLNGDKIDDWVVDGSAYPCPSRPAALADQGALITVFIASADGRVHPALQKAGFGSHLERRPNASLVLFLTLGSSDCGETTSNAHCDRQVEWHATQQRLDLMPVEITRPLPRTNSSKPERAANH